MKQLSKQQLTDLRNTAARELGSGLMQVPTSAGGKVSRKRHKDTIPTAVRGPQRKPVPKLSLFNLA
jgi:hypothetical protein